MKKFKVGDIVQGIPDKKYWSEDELPFIAEVRYYDDDDNVVLNKISGRLLLSYARERYLILCPEYIIDKVLQKYSDA